MCGARSLQDAESMTRDMAPATRRTLGIRRRVPDTTLRDILCRLEPSCLVRCLHRQIHASFRRKALAPQGLPFHVVAMDGKCTSLPAWDDRYTQKRTNDHQALPYGLMRTVTCTLASAAAKPCIHVSPIPAQSNEVGHFARAFSELNAVFGNQFRMVTYDAGAASEANAELVSRAGKDYVFRLRDERRHQVDLANTLLENQAIIATTEDILSNKKTVIRQLQLFSVPPQWAHDGEHLWSSAKSYLRVRTIFKFADGTETTHEVRDFISSLNSHGLTPQQWLYVIRSHWSVENENHHTFDRFFAEDKKPGITYDTNGMLILLLLRRMAYNLMALFRRVTLRSEERRLTPWRELIRWFYNVAIVGTTGPPGDDPVGDGAPDATVLVYQARQHAAV